MNAILMPNDRMLIPMRAESDNGDIGDGWIEIGPDDPRYEEWLPFAMTVTDEGQ